MPPFNVAAYNQKIREFAECEKVPGIRMCDASFRESTVEDLRAVAPGVVRINWHERAPVKSMAAGVGEVDKGIPDEVF